MLRDFENWLIENKYKPTTALDYSLRIDRICRKYAYNLDYLCSHIKEILPEYEKNGIKASYGKYSHTTVRQALRKFMLFLSSSKLVDVAE